MRSCLPAAETTVIYYKFLISWKVRQVDGAQRYQSSFAVAVTLIGGTTAAQGQDGSHLGGGDRILAKGASAG